MGRALVASLALVLGCKAGAGPTTPSAPARLASRSTEERAQPHAAAAKQPVLAVISIGDPLGWMSEIDAHILPPHLRGGADEQAIRGILSRALGGTTPMGDKVDLGSPIGCAVGDPRSKEPLACVFGYAGGSDAFVVDAGGSPGDEAMTALNMRSQRVYVAPLRERVVVSTDRDLLAASHTALGMLPTERTKHPHDVEAVVYPSAVLDAFADRLDAVVARVITKQVDAAGDDPLAAALIRARVAQGVAMAAGFSEVEEAALWLDVAADRSAIGYRGRAAPGTATATTYAVAHETGPIDPTTLGRTRLRAHRVALRVRRRGHRTHRFR
jgi:hypothetical protein